MNLLAAGVAISVIAIWLGHQNTHSTDAYLHADMAIKLAAIDRTDQPTLQPAHTDPEPDILDCSPAMNMPILRTIPAT